VELNPLIEPSRHDTHLRIPHLILGMGKVYDARMDEGRKRVLAMVAGSLVARHLKTAADLFRSPQGSPRTDAMVAAAVQWADRIMRKIDNVFG